MNATTPVARAAIGVLMACSVAWAGDLNPPPGPIMPTDDVVLNAQAIPLPYTITQPGAYRLTSNFIGGSPSDGIQIMSDNVWLDLGGFTLDGAGAPGDGIVLLGPYHDITILNGAVINWGDDGIDLKQGSDNRIHNVHVANNANDGIGANRTEVLDSTALANGSNGILCLDHSIVKRCRATSNAASGILVDNGSLVASCTTQANGTDGINAFMQCVVIDCTASDHASGPGIIGGEHTKIADCVATRNVDGIINFVGGLIVDCVATENTSLGFFTDIGGMVTNCKASRNLDGFTGILGAKFTECTALENSNFGFFVDDGTVVRDCTAGLNGVTGINVASKCEIANNHVWSNGGGGGGAGGAGIECLGPANRISDNDTKDNPNNYLDTVGANTYFGNSSSQPSGLGAHYNIFFAPNDVAPLSTAAAGPTRYANTIY